MRNAGGTVAGEAVVPLGDAGAPSALVSDATGALALDGAGVRDPEPTLEGTGSMSPVAFRDGVHALVMRTRKTTVSFRSRPRVARCSDIGGIRPETASPIKRCRLAEALVLGSANGRKLPRRQE